MRALPKTRLLTISVTANPQPGANARLAPLIGVKEMQVKIYDTDETGNETLRSQCELRDCFPDDEDNFQHAWAELKRSGRVWVGGGAEPLTLIMRT